MLLKFAEKSSSWGEKYGKFEFLLFRKRLAHSRRQPIPRRTREIIGHKPLHSRTSTRGYFLFVWWKSSFSSQKVQFNPKFYKHDYGRNKNLGSKMKLVRKNFFDSKPKILIRQNFSVRKWILEFNFI